MTKPNKYRAKPVWVCRNPSCELWHGEGHMPFKDARCSACRSVLFWRFPSRLEAGRFAELRRREKAGIISNLELQPLFEVKIKGVVALTYKADFRYLRTADNKRVTEDTKGKPTPAFLIKKRCVEAYFPGLKIEIIKDVRAA